MPLFLAKWFSDGKTHDVVSAIFFFQILLVKAWWSIGFHDIKKVGHGLILYHTLATETSWTYLYSVQLGRVLPKGESFV